VGNQGAIGFGILLTRIKRAATDLKSTEHLKVLEKKLYHPGKKIKILEFIIDVIILKCRIASLWI
jgi:hypothetical protein